ncbi:hypothetical protein [Fusibacillus kribbianus]|uniref:Uncharacterized protein n=1 Tax=Fusibacillus kribbianus TaxID=3044208 RepID=A0AAP4BE52_9FIRM|nr:hypothetical protein [Ruminococcus sp. YH-rum2234]MDI9243411.1 hypothetical protein [Ruminococcus sp. YH-rum2234]
MAAKKSTMERGAHIRTGIKRIQKPNQRRENILPGEELRPELLPVGKNNINHGSHDLGYDNVGLQFFEAVHMIEQKINRPSQQKLQMREFRVINL